MAAPTTPEERARRRMRDFSSLMWHIGTYVVVNAFLWTVDLAAGGGLEFAFWTTIPWGLALAFHVLAYLLSERRMQATTYERFLAEEREREAAGR
ncbi:MAG TPA: 2TM domain-containing protein [Acidimicrobiia bacterium]|nr:2TM domain-containing protein [Acidimicrobiia bacterium]